LLITERPGKSYELLAPLLNITIIAEEKNARFDNALNPDPQ
jgi:hypothetical protein